MILLIISLIILLALSAILSASETAMFSLSPLKAKVFSSSSSKGKRVAAHLLKNPRDLLVTILMINIAVNLGVQNVVSNIFGKFPGWLITVGVPLLLTLVIGEVLPKSFAISRNYQIAPRVAPFLYVIRYIFTPLRIIFLFLATRISKVMFFFLKKEKDISITELKHALKTSKEQGILSEDEAKLLQGTLKIDEMVVKEIMRPRQEILFFDIREPLSKLMHIFVDQECGQIPLIDGSLENALGILASEDYFIHKENIHTCEDLVKFAYEPLIIPESVTARMLLTKFHESGEDIALVVDEYGQTAGLITKEDIVEIIIGQIEDKRDEKVLFTRQGEDVIICSGKLELEDLSEIFDVHLESESNMATVGGWLTEVLGDIPKSGLKHIHENLLFHVLSASSTKVSRLYIRKLTPINRKQRSN